VCANEFDKEHGLEAYFMQCSTQVNCIDLAKMAATCANNGINPITKKQVVPLEINEEMMSVMMTCGMYNGAGNWMVDVGIPAKSGVSGGIFGVVPGVCGLAVFSPRLNSAFNSVRGIEAFRELSQRMGLHVLQKRKGGVSFMAPFVGRKSKINGARGSSISQSLIAAVSVPHPKKANTKTVAPDVENQTDNPRIKTVKVTPRASDSPRDRHGAALSQGCVVEAWTNE
jgi:glutaminase